MIVERMKRVEVQTKALHKESSLFGKEWSQTNLHAHTFTVAVLFRMEDFGDGETIGEYEVQQELHSVIRSNLMPVHGELWQSFGEWSCGQIAEKLLEDLKDLPLEVLQVDDGEGVGAELRIQRPSDFKMSQQDQEMMRLREQVEERLATVGSHVTVSKSNLRLLLDGIRWAQRDSRVVSLSLGTEQALTALEDELGIDHDVTNRDWR